MQFLNFDVLAKYYLYLFISEAAKEKLNAENVSLVSLLDSIEIKGNIGMKWVKSRLLIKS